ncbi:radical SAM protein [Candidatus Woesearchaeota archaeon CG10_big_fil_rev_8_21_14_0_10_34_8]|nr:MAG: radical SAM protein [Candidatus Woesearchaeota archaeon CG10_big_fil_rev_8_21_14_0_10_34_8]
MAYAILDCYTDEASGLGVPPYLGVYPRYIYGYLRENFPDDDVFYLTIDDLRLWKKHKGKNPNKDLKKSGKTNITVYNLTKNSEKIAEILEKIDELIVILGVHVPGKYLSAMPGTLHEVTPLLNDIKCHKVLTGPAVFGTQLFGGKFSEKIDLDIFEVRPFNFSFDEIAKYGVKGAEIIEQIPWIKMIEIETGKGCNVGKCSFCTEPLKSKILFRDNKDIVTEIKNFYDLGERYFRLGKQTCFYSLPDPVGLLRQIRKECPEIKVLHIDNVNPVFVCTKRGEEITKAIVEHCTSGNIAAFGIESFDPAVTKANTLNCNAETAMKAIRIMNKYGKDRGDNGMPKFLPGLNIIFGLAAESKETHKINMEYMHKILDEDLWLRRINIRQVALFPGTALYELGDKWLKKNKKWYWKWRNQIRQEIDFPMLQKIVPTGTVLKDCYAEIYDGNTTFMRQLGTYPLIVGVKGRYELKKFYDLRITKHMLRSLTGEVLEE